MIYKYKLPNAPIVLFVYNRLAHTKKTVEALLANEESKNSVLYIYSDASKTDGDKTSVDNVRKYISTITGFKEIKIVERETNYGLAKNIINGVTEVLGNHDRVIVLEDDIVTSPCFLRFMNAALDKYQMNKRVWHVSGWNYDIETTHLSDVYFWRVMNCWGWGTWYDRWKHYKKDPELLIKTWTDDMIREFNLDESHDFWRQVRQNYNGVIDTWAIFWYATIFENHGLCLNPAVSYVKNIGHDGTGENCRKERFSGTTTLNNKLGEFPDEACESVIALEEIKKYYRRNNNLIKGLLRRAKKISIFKDK